ncbi:protein S-acyltransferase 18-like [Gossypium australe]|uniref:Protein S-acyltransferase 18-like n=1 Tax=Gossypium australe TaxID=47621 RepID=A0A5B6UYX6_9ROSI|nr:protein S-acyltransferase 18-like [Gossypium australe]
MMKIMRRHGWQRPLHPLQMVGMAVYSFLVVAFYTFLGLFLGNRIAEITITTIFSFVVMFFTNQKFEPFFCVLCTAIDPTNKTSFKKKKKGKSKGILKLNYGFILTQIVVRFFRRLEKKILRTFIRRKYLDPWKTNFQMEPLLPFPLVMKDDAVSPDVKEDDNISYCSLCDFEVKNIARIVGLATGVLKVLIIIAGCDHHCRLILEGATAIAIFIRCFADKKGIEQELEKRLYIKFPREVLSTITGMRTYDYILAMKEENQFTVDSFDGFDVSSDDNSNFDSPRKRNILVEVHMQRTKNSSIYKITKT